MARPNSTSVPARTLERALLAAARLDEAASRSPVSAGWLQRSRFAAAERLAAAEGHAQAPDRLLAAVLGLPVSAHADGGATAAALRWFAGVRGQRGGDRRQKSEVRGDATVSAEPDPAAAALAGRVAAAAARLAAQRSSRAGVLGGLPGSIAALMAEGMGFATVLAAIPRFLAEARVLSAAWPAFAVVPEGGGPEASGWAGRLLGALADQADAERLALDRLEASWAGWHDGLGALRSNARLPRLLQLVASLPGLSSVFVAERLTTPHRSCTVAGASFLLKSLVARGVLVEASRRRSWRLYVPADLALLRDIVRPPGPRKRKAAPDRQELLADERAPLSLDGIELTRLERARPFSDRDAEWAALIADIDRAALKARIVIERKTSSET
jgi:hypothetical protein